MLRTETQTGLKRYLPILDWLPGYPRQWLRSDLIAGLVAAAVVIPQAMAYATIAGLPVEVGLYTALVPMVIYTIFGTSRPLSVSATSTIAMLTATTLSGVSQSSNPYDYIVPAATLAFLTGIFLVLAGILRMGFLANLISLPVLTGFKAGIGVVIFVGQLGKVIGIPIEKGPILQTILTLLKSLDQINWPTLGIAIVTVGIMVLLPRLVKRVPAALIAISLGILLSALVDLEALGVALVGEIPPGLPSLSLPDFSLLQELWPGALGIALMSFVESIAAARAFARQGDPIPDVNQELIAIGVANIGGGLSQAMPGGGGTSQTAVNNQAGAKSQVAELVTAGVVLATLMFLSSLIGLMPAATLGALVLVAAAGLVKVDEFREIIAVGKIEFSWALIAFFGVIVLGTLEGILLAVIASLLILIWLAGHPPVYIIGRKPGTHIFRPLAIYPEDETFPGLLILRPEGLLYFASISRALESITSLVIQNKPKILALDLSTVPNIEYTALKSLHEYEVRLANSGITLWLAALTPEAFKAVERTQLGKTLGHTRMFFNLEQVVKAYQKLEMGE